MALKKDAIETRHDFFIDRSWMFFLCGFAQKKHIAYYIYIFCTFVVYFYLKSMAIWACYLNAPNKILLIDSLHVVTLASFGTFGLSSRILTDKSLRRTQAMIKDGIYNYEDEELDEEQVKMKEGTVSEIRRKTKSFFVIFVTGAVSNLVFFPISQLIVYTQDSRIDTGKAVDPYLPHVIYAPLGTRTVYGYMSGYLASFLLLFLVYSTAISMNQILISCVVQIKVNLKVLNHSLRNIQKRAYKKYTRSNKIHPDIMPEDLYGRVDFQKCLYSCFRANIKHHQALLKFKKECQPFSGACLLDTILLGTIIYASFLYLSFTNLPLNYLANYICTLLVEQTFPMHECLYGEDTIEESTILFEELYGMPWFHYNKSLNKALNIVMAMNLKPLRLKALVLDASASYESYGDLVCAVYKIMSLVRQSDL